MINMDIQAPELFDSMGEAKIAAVYVNDGQAVTANQALFDVELEKAVLEVIAPSAGIVYDFKAKVGDVIHSEQVIMLLREKLPGEQTADKKLPLEEEVAFLKAENARLKQQLEEQQLLIATD